QRQSQCSGSERRHQCRQWPKYWRYCVRGLQARTKGKRQLRTDQRKSSDGQRNVVLDSSRIYAGASMAATSRLVRTPGQVRSGGTAPGNNNTPLLPGPFPIGLSAGALANRCRTLNHACRSDIGRSYLVHVTPVGIRPNTRKAELKANGCRDCSEEKHPYALVHAHCSLTLSL